MVKHTPGPWRVGKSYGAVVSDNPVEDRPPSPYGSPEDEVEAYGGYLIAESITPSNRPIIAAAPELYDALANTLCRICDVYIGDPPKPDMNPCTECAQARAALAKARGGAS